MFAFAQALPARAPHSNDRADEQDFVNIAAERVSGQMAHAQLALQRAADAATRQIAQNILSQDSQILSNLKQVAAQQHFSLPGRLSAESQEEQNVLSLLKGVDFDADYTDMTWRRLTFDIPRFEAEEKVASVSELAAFAAKSVPMMRQQYSSLSNIAYQEHENNTERPPSAP